MSDYSSYSTEELQQLLCSHVHNTQFYRMDQYSLYSKCIIREDWSGKNRRRIDFKDVLFDCAKLDRAGFAGSVFTHCTFTGNSQLNGVNFSACNFIDCTFEGVKCSAFFNKSKLSNTIFNNCTLMDCSYEDAYLDSVTFNCCNIISANWENCNLNAATFKECKLKSLNFEYAIWGDVHFNSTEIPFQTIPFIFGGPEYILSTKDTAQIKSKVHPLSVDEYRGFLPALLEFYVRTHNWFPAINLLLAFGNTDEALNLLLQGSKNLIVLRKFRTLKYLIALSNRSKVLPARTKSHLYQELAQLLDNLEMDKSIDDFDRRMYINTLRSSMLPTEQGLCYLTLKTDIDHANTESVNAVYEFTELYATTMLNASHEIKISHNSPVVLDVALALAPAVIEAAAALLNTVLSKVLDKKKKATDEETLKEALHKFRSDLTDADIHNIVRSVARYEPALESVNIQIIQATLPPETTSCV